MKCYRLRSYDQTPPGGYPFEQTNPHKSFPSQPMIEAQASILSRWRKANNVPRSELRECLEDVDHYQCQRLGNMPQFCTPCAGELQAVALSQTSPIIAPPCHGCGAPVG